MPRNTEKRSVPVTTRVTTGQKAALDQLAKEAKMSLSDYLLAGRMKEIIKKLETT